MNLRIFILFIYLTRELLCWWSKHIYVTTVAACPSTIQLQEIRDTISCFVNSSCTSIACCVEVENLDQTFEVVLDLDFCNQRITFGVERLLQTEALKDFDFGEVICMRIFSSDLWDTSSNSLDKKKLPSDWICNGVTAITCTKV